MFNLKPNSMSLEQYKDELGFPNGADELIIASAEFERHQEKKKAMTQFFLSGGKNV